MRPDSAAHIWDALQAARLIGTFIAGKSEDGFLDDRLLQSAVERQLEILGEALNRLRRTDPATAERVPDLDRIISMRNVIAHQYTDVDHQILWAAVRNRVPTLIPALDMLLTEAGPAPGN